ncbi:glycoside hydrolase family 2 TIM barrel-domain containing protein [Myxococcus faecalis]|uniref:glycoside hydrolase family 2 TIM barrel-domain containing protein n=1 Tax=Myxococcus faecalis TaxID=3115646 RepID=UPI0038D1E891
MAPTLRCPGVVLVWLFAVVLSVGPVAEARTTLVKGEGGWSLQVDGRPHVAKGVTFSGSAGSAAYEQDCARLAALGVNTLRTWGVGPQTQPLLDAAHKHGLKVLVGLWMRHGQPGAEDDDSFDYLTDTAGMKKQREDTLESVRRYKDHPAVLAWGVGNEVILNSPNDAAKEAYARFLEGVVRDIKKVDDAHPVISVDAWVLAVKWWEKLVPSLDAYGLNVYGRGLQALPEALRKEGATKPWLITEFGAQGEWDAPKDERGVPREPDDREKHAVIVDAWNTLLAPHVRTGDCLGLFVFNFSSTFDHSSLWLGMLSGKSTRPAWHAVREAYTGQKPQPPLPEVGALVVQGVKKETSGSWADVAFEVKDPQGRPLDISFAYNFRGAATRFERGEVIRLRATPGATPNSWRVKLPSVKGPIKLYGLAKDASGNLMTATTSVLISSAP